MVFSQYLKFNPIGTIGDKLRWPLRLVPTWFESLPPDRVCMGVLQALARAKGHIIPVSAFMPLLMASWTSILEGLSSPTRVVVVLCVLYIVVEVVLRGTTTIRKNIFVRKFINHSRKQIYLFIILFPFWLNLLENKKCLAIEVFEFYRLLSIRIQYLIISIIIFVYAISMLI